MDPKPNPERAALVKAVEEAKRFVDRAETALKIPDGRWFWTHGAKATAKRASLDLTRALAHYRQGGR
jgi:hypothetical protein